MNSAPGSSQARHQRMACSFRLQRRRAARSREFVLQLIYRERCGQESRWRSTLLRGRARSNGSKIDQLDSHSRIAGQRPRPDRALRQTHRPAPARDRNHLERQAGRPRRCVTSRGGRRTAQSTDDADDRAGRSNSDMTETAKYCSDVVRSNGSADAKRSISIPWSSHGVKRAWSTNRGGKTSIHAIGTRC